MVQRPRCPSPGVAAKGQKALGLVRREATSHHGAVLSLNPSSGSPGTFPRLHGLSHEGLTGPAQASSPQCSLHALQVPVDELGLQVMVERVIPFL